MENRFNKGNIFYGWIIVCSGFILMGTTMGIAFNSASIFIKPVSDELMFSRTQINITVTIRALCQMVIAFFSGKIYAKYKIKRIMQISAIILPISFFSFSFSNSLLSYYAITFVVSISSVFLSILPLSFIISNWFHERQGSALGLTFMGSGVGGMVFNYLAGIWITTYGWRFTYKILSIIIAIAVIPCVFLLIRIHPKEMGLLPLGQIKDDRSKCCDNEEGGFLLSEVIKTITFWSIILTTVLVSMSVHSLLHNIAPHLTDSGYSIKFSANIASLSMGSLAISKVLMGRLYDKLGIHKGITSSCIATLFGLLGLIFANYYIGIILIIIGAGIGCTYNTMANPIIAQKVFGRRDYSSIYGVLTAATGLGGVISPMVTGYVFDITGSYNISFIIMIGFILMATVIYQFSLPEETKTTSI